MTPSAPERARSRRQALLQRRLLLGVRRSEREAAHAAHPARLAEKPSPDGPERRPAP